MKIELIILAITIFFIINTYSDGKYVKIVKSWKKYYQMAGIGFIGLSAYIFMRKHPSHSKNLLCHANGLIKYLPIDKEASDLLSPLISGSGLFANSTNGGMMAQERRLLQSGGNSMQGGGMQGGGMQGGNSVQCGGMQGGGNIKATKRSVSETKKKYVAAAQGWNCGACKKQLPAWFEVDHKIRLDSGGSNNVDNLVALCRDCHGKKTAFENL
jgi:hypothetical protein